MRPYVNSIIACLAVSLFTALPFTGLNLILVLLVLAVLFAKGLFRAWKHPEQRTVFFTKATIWSLWLAIASSIHFYYFEAARSAGDQAVQALISFKVRNGRYPNKLSEADQKIAAGAEKSRIAYHFEDGKPRLIYWGTFMIYSAYDYDFDAGRWVFVGG